MPAAPLLCFFICQCCLSHSFLFAHALSEHFGQTNFSMNLGWISFASGLGGLFCNNLTGQFYDVRMPTPDRCVQPHGWDTCTRLSSRSRGRERMRTPPHADRSAPRSPLCRCRWNFVSCLPFVCACVQNATPAGSNECAGTECYRYGFILCGCASAVAMIVALPLVRHTQKGRRNKNNAKTTPH